MPCHSVDDSVLDYYLGEESDGETSASGEAGTASGTGTGAGTGTGTGAVPAGGVEDPPEELLVSDTVSLRVRMDYLLY